MPTTVTESYERGAERLLETVTAACVPGACFAEQVEAAFRATLALFAAEPELGRLLTVRPFDGGDEAIDCYLRGQRRCGELLRAAAARDPGAYVHPPFVAPALISGICWRISRYLAADGAEHLQDLLPDLLQFVFVSYFGAERAGQLIRSGYRASGCERGCEQKRG
jgi:hypothetical protein